MTEGMLYRMCAELGILRSHDFRGLHWTNGSGLASIGDVLRVHEWSYVRDLQNACAVLATSGAKDGDTTSRAGGDGMAEGALLSEGVAAKPEAIGHLDGDTAISGGSFRAALAAAGAVMHAVDRVVAGEVGAPCQARPLSCPGKRIFNCFVCLSLSCITTMHALGYRPFLITQRSARPICESSASQHALMPCL